jgi:Mn2+/Fe2+ NRAMP family transporter
MGNKAQGAALLAAIFLMATSAIGPGFLTQTAKFTGELGPAFAFAIVISLLIDIGAQLNIWRIVSLKSMSATEIANTRLPYLGHLLAVLILIGGLGFNIGNVAGAGLGLNLLLGLDVRWGAFVSALLAILLFSSKNTLRGMDWLSKLLGLLMIGLVLYTAFSSDPPLGAALRNCIWPEKVDFLSIITIVGGTVGGYIAFSGAHRLLDAGITGPDRVGEVSRGAVTGILLTTLMRALLFLAALGIVEKGLVLEAANPAASVFVHALGAIGGQIFGLVLWSAAITSVIGSAYTSISFLKSLHPVFERYLFRWIAGFIALSTLVFLISGKPAASVLVWVGAINGFILPLSLGIMLLAVRGERYSRLLQFIGWFVVAVMGYFALKVVLG